MTFEDPFLSVKEEVSKALIKTKVLYERWTELQIDPNSNQIEKEWTTTELRNSLRSIEWELEDLEDTISIIEKNPSKFKLDIKELSNRKNFIEQFRQEVKCMREKLNYSRGLDKDKTAKQPYDNDNSLDPLLYETTMPLLDNLANMKMSNSSHNTTKYSKLENQIDSPERTQFTRNAVAQQEEMLREQDDHLDLISGTVGSLKTMSQHIAVELDEQADMLDDLQHEMEQTDSRISYTLKRVVKVLHLSDDRSQWIALGILSLMLIVILILFIAL